MYRIFIGLGTVGSLISRMFSSLWLAVMNKGKVIGLSPTVQLINNAHGQPKILELHIKNVVGSKADLIHYVYGVNISGYRSRPTD